MAAMSLRSEGYEPAMAKAGASPDTEDLLEKWQAVWYFYQNRSGELPSDMFGPLYYCDVAVTAIRSAILAGGVVLMRDLDRMLALANPPQRVASDIFGKGTKAPSPWPSSWTASMIHEAKEKNRLAGKPRLTGGPLG